ncbi:MAG TPA: hypothetical protein VFW66_07960 [Gemmatimonadales bacterium]|nr:hypothetical protein [Gemmatimonadales bacterium]
MTNRAALRRFLAFLLAAAPWVPACRPSPADHATGSARSGPQAVPQGTARRSDPVPACGGRCGAERWAIKTLSDRRRDEVRTDTVVATTIDHLIAIPAPAQTTPYRRIAPVETTVYRVEARLVGWVRERDHDFHLILASPRDPSATMVAEIPDPECAGACLSGYSEAFARMRQEVVQRFEASGAVPGGSEEAPLVTITGVGFFDREHEQRGAAPNQIELHPVLSLRFR